MKVDNTKKNMGLFWRKAVNLKSKEDSVAVPPDAESRENASVYPVSSSGTATTILQRQSSKPEEVTPLKYKLPKKNPISKIDQQTERCATPIDQLIDEEVAKMTKDMNVDNASKAKVSVQPEPKNEEPWPVMKSNKAQVLAASTSLPAQPRSLKPSPSLKIPQSSSMVVKSSNSSLATKASSKLLHPRTPIRAQIKAKQMIAWPVKKSHDAQVLTASTSLPTQSRKAPNHKQVPREASMVTESSKNVSAGKISKYSPDRTSENATVNKSNSTNKKPVSPVKNRYHAEKLKREEEAASAASIADDIAAAKKMACRPKKKISALQQFRDEEAAKAKHQARINADMEQAATKRRKQDITNTRKCLLEKTDATPRYANGEKDQNFEINDKSQSKKNKRAEGWATNQPTAVVGDEEELAVHSTKSNRSNKNSLRPKASDGSLTITHKLPTKKAKRNESQAAAIQPSKPLKTKVENVSKQPKAASDEDKSDESPDGKRANNENSTSKMSSQSKARMKRHNLATNSLTEQDAIETFPDVAIYDTPKYACFGSKAIIPDATSEESDMIGDEIVREASNAIGNVLNIDPEEVKVNIDRVVEDVNSPKGLFGMKWFQRSRSERSSQITQNDSIFDGLDSITGIMSKPTKKKSRGFCYGNVLTDLVCGAEEVIVEQEGELRIRNVASVFSDDEVIEVDGVLADDTFEDSDTDVGSGTDEEFALVEEYIEELDFDVYTPIREQVSQSFEEECSHYETGTETEGSDLDEIIDENEFDGGTTLGSETDFDSVSATTSSSASGSFDNESDDEVSNSVSGKRSSAKSKRQSIPERNRPTPIAVQSPISTCDESKQDSVGERKISSFGRVTPTLSSLFKKAISSPRAKKNQATFNADAGNAIIKSRAAETKKISEACTAEAEIPAQVLCPIPVHTGAPAEEDKSYDQVPSNAPAKELSNKATNAYGDNETKIVTAEVMDESAATAEVQMLPCDNNAIDRAPSTLSKHSVQDVRETFVGNTATTLEESTANESGSAMIGQISQECEGIEVSFPSNSDKEQQSLPVDKHPVADAQDQSKKRPSLEADAANEFGHEVETEMSDGIVASFSRSKSIDDGDKSTVTQESANPTKMYLSKSQENGAKIDINGSDTPVSDKPSPDISEDHDVEPKIEEGISQDTIDSIEKHDETRQDASHAESDSCREESDEAKREDCNVDAGTIVEPIYKDKSFSSNPSLDRSSSKASATSDGIEFKNSIKAMGHVRRRSRVGKIGSFLIDKMQRSSVQNE